MCCLEPADVHPAVPLVVAVRARVVTTAAGAGGRTRYLHHGLPLLPQAPDRRGEQLTVNSHCSVLCMHGTVWLTYRNITLPLS